MQGMLNWNDIRILLALERCATLVEAAALLGVDPTTVARRLAAAEDALGARLFVRAHGRFRPTASGEAVLERARAVEEAAMALENVLGAGSTAVGGVVRLASVEALIAWFLVPRLGVLRQRHPDLTLELVGGPRNVSFARGEADLAVRLGRVASDEVVVRRLGELGYGVFGHRALVARFAGDAERLRTAPWLGYDDSLADTPEARWLAGRLDDARPVLRFTTLHPLISALRAGLGMGLVPICMAGDLPELVRVDGPAPTLSRELWLALHPNLRQTARVRAVADWVVEQCERDRELLAGVSTPPPGGP